MVTLVAPGRAHTMSVRRRSFLDQPYLPQDRNDFPECLFPSAGLLTEAWVVLLSAAAPVTTRCGATSFRSISTPTNHNRRLTLCQLLACDYRSCLPTVGSAPGILFSSKTGWARWPSSDYRTPKPTAIGGHL